MYSFLLYDNTYCRVRLTTRELRRSDAHLHSILTRAAQPIHRSKSTTTRRVTFGSDDSDSDSAPPMSAVPAVHERHAHYRHYWLKHFRHKNPPEPPPKPRHSPVRNVGNARYTKQYAHETCHVTDFHLPPQRRRPSKEHSRYNGDVWSNACHKCGGRRSPDDDFSSVEKCLNLLTSNDNGNSQVTRRDRSPWLRRIEHYLTEFDKERCTRTPSELAYEKACQQLLKACEEIDAITTSRVSPRAQSRRYEVSTDYPTTTAKAYTAPCTPTPATPKDDTHTQSYEQHVRRASVSHARLPMRAMSPGAESRIRTRVLYKFLDTGAATAIGNDESASVMQRSSSFPERLACFPFGCGDNTCAQTQPQRTHLCLQSMLELSQIQEADSCETSTYLHENM